MVMKGRPAAPALPGSQGAAAASKGPTAQVCVCHSRARALAAASRVGTACAPEVAPTRGERRACGSLHASYALLQRPRHFSLADRRGAVACMHSIYR